MRGLYCLLHMVEPDSDNSIFRFFEIAPDEYSFSAIAEHKRIQQLLTSLRTNKISSLPIYMYKRSLANESGRFEILSATDSDFVDKDQCREFFSSAMEHEHRFIKIVATRAAELQPHFIDTVTEKLHNHSPHRARKVREMVEQISIIADIVDVTRESAELYIDQLNHEI